MEPLTDEDRASYVAGFATLLAHDDPAIRAAGRGLLDRLLAMGHWAATPNIEHPVFGRAVRG